MLGRLKDSVGMVLSTGSPRHQVFSNLALFVISTESHDIRALASATRGTAPEDTRGTLEPLLSH